MNIHVYIFGKLDNENNVILKNELIEKYADIIKYSEMNNTYDIHIDIMDNDLYYKLINDINIKLSDNPSLFIKIKKQYDHEYLSRYEYLALMPRYVIGYIEDFEGADHLKFEIRKTTRQQN